MAALADYLTSPRAHLAPEIWAANGSNEVMLHVPRPSAAPGALCLELHPHLLHSRVRPQHTDRLRHRERRKDFTSTSDDAVNVISGCAGRRPGQPQQPDLNPFLPLEDIKRILEAFAATAPCSEPRSPRLLKRLRRRGLPSSAARAYGALELVGLDNPHLAVTRTMSSLGAAGLRLGYLRPRAGRSPCAWCACPTTSAVTQAAALAALSHRDEPSWLTPAR